MVVATHVKGLFEELLGVQGVNEDSDFFLLGGHSLLLIKLAARVRKQLRVEVSVPALFAARTCRAMTGLIEAALNDVSALAADASMGGVAGGAEAGAAASMNDSAALDFAALGRARVFERWLARPLGAAFNRPYHFRVRSLLSAQEIAQALCDVIRAEPAFGFCLRLGRQGGVELTKVSTPWAPTVITAIACEAEIDADDVFWSPIDLEWGPWVRAAVVAEPGLVHVLLCSHVLAEDFCPVPEILSRALNACGARSSGVPGSCSPDSTQRPAPAAVTAVSGPEERRAAIEGLRGLSWCALPVEPTRAALGQGQRSGHVVRSLSMGVLNALNQAAQAAGVEPEELLFAAFAFAVHRASGMTEFLMLARVPRSRRSPRARLQPSPPGHFVVPRLRFGPNQDPSEVLEHAVQSLREAARFSAAEVLGLYSPATGGAALPLCFEWETGDGLSGYGSEAEIERVLVLSREADSELKLCVNLSSRNPNYRIEYRKPEVSRAEAEALDSDLWRLLEVHMPALIRLVR